MAVSGKLIVIEGTDGSGKATQTDRLLQRLRQEGHGAVSVSFPQYEKSFFGDMIGRYLRGELGPATEISPYLASVLYAGDRWEARDQLRGWLAEARVVICNRYVSANLGHQAGKIGDPAERKRFAAWVARLEYEVFGLPRPDLTLLLHMPCEIGQRLVDEKSQRGYLREGRRDAHESDLNHLHCAEEAFLEMAAADLTWVKIECAPDGRLLPRDAIAERIWGCVRRGLESGVFCRQYPGPKGTPP